MGFECSFEIEDLKESNIIVGRQCLECPELWAEDLGVGHEFHDPPQVINCFVFFDVQAGVVRVENGEDCSSVSSLSFRMQLRVGTALIVV